MDDTQKLFYLLTTVTTPSLGTHTHIAHYGEGHAEAQTHGPEHAR